jgi:FkbM family methyltransferase
MLFLLGQQKMNLLVTYLDRIRSLRGNPSFGQEGEDRVLASLLLKISSPKLAQHGFYIDVGAHHPYRYSNTHIFYKRGWHGINIDATPGSMAAFRRARPRDICLEVGIGARHGTQTFYVFNDSALNTFDRALALARAIPPWKIERTIEVPISPLADILQAHMSIGQAIDFLNIDVEGLDMVVLHSNDWTRFRPKVILVETLGQSIDEVVASSATHFLKSLGYTFYSKTVNTSFFIDSKCIE